MGARLLALSLYGAVFVAGSLTAGAAPLASGCTRNNTGQGFTCNLYESENGESSNAVTLPSSVAAGYVVLLESGDPNNSANQNSVANWSDVLLFLNANGAAAGDATTVQLVSDGSGLFPSLPTVLGHGHAFILETQTGSGSDNTDVTVWAPNPNTYNVFSDAPVRENDVPEPASISLLGAGLIGLGAVARKLTR